MFVRKITGALLALAAVVPLSGCMFNKGAEITNPLVKNVYAADPSVLKFNGKYYLYATIDPWGGSKLAVFRSDDMVNWERLSINWPTKEQCTSPTSNRNLVWAPSVVKGLNGKFYMYVSVGSEIWVGVSDHPLGPWSNAKPDNSPLVAGNAMEGCHMIDAECFIDDDGRAYLYWGSGLGWKDGKCLVVELKSDMVGFDGEITDITPPNYFEAPFMVKQNGVYYLMYSEGKCIDSTYKIRYSTGNTPLGPWTEGVSSPILATSADSTTLGPGHHAVYFENGRHYILYHRIAYNKNTLLREICIDELEFDSDGIIRRIEPEKSVWFD